MKYKCLLFIACLVTFLCNGIATYATVNQNVIYDPLLVVVLMVKDEEHVMESTLQPYVDAGVKAYLILDTGSTDRTIEVTHAFFKKNHITHYFIEQEAFVDFSTSRNRALDYAEQRFPQAGFMLMVDAEWYMHNVKGLLEYCAQEVNSSSSCYFIRLITPQLDYFLPRMMRAGRKVRYIGVVHETIEIADGKVPATIWFEVKTTERGDTKSKNRWIRDRDMLLKHLQKHPDSPRDTFYLAQTFGCLKDLDSAYKYYLIRTEMKGWDEENFMTWYRLGEICEIKGEQEDPELWGMRALQFYLKAYAYRPWRIEPLVRLAYRYYKKGEFATGYIFAKIACEAGYPLYDILFVEKDFYNFYRYDLLSQCALAVGSLEVGEWATRKAIEARPDVAHLYRYLSAYLEAKVAAKRNAQVEEQTLHKYRNVPPSPAALA